MNTFAVSFSGENMKTLNNNSYETRVALASINAIVTGVISRMAAGDITESEKKDLSAISSAEISRQINNRIGE